MKWALIAVCAILLAPLAVVDVPPLLDYPNHLARAVVLAFGDSDPDLSRIYAAHWTIIPNLGLDLVLPPLMQVLPIHLAGRIVLGIAILLPVIGTVAYSRATFRTASAWPLASGLVAYNATLLLGFINFTAAIGIAFLLAAVVDHLAGAPSAPCRGTGRHRHGRAVLLSPDGPGAPVRADRRPRVAAALARPGYIRRPSCCASPPWCRWPPCRLSCTSYRSLPCCQPTRNSHRWETSCDN